MKISKLKKVYAFELQNRYKEIYKLDEIDYRLRQFLEDICEEGLYERDNTKRKARLTITFPLFLLCVFLMTVFSCIKWLFTGNIYLNNRWWAVKKLVEWDRYCNFNIV